MNRFREELKNGKFMCSECPACKEIVWPPSEFCDICLGQVRWRNVLPEGDLLEYSRRGGEWFGMVEVEGKIRILGTILSEGEPKIGQRLYLEKCGYDDGEKFLFRVIRT